MGAAAAERLRWADAVVCVLTSAYLASVWCTAELVTAQNRGSRLLPVRAEPGADHPLLKAVQRADAATDICMARAKLAGALRRIDDAGGSGWADDRSPFPGLRPFDTDLHRVFFGRTREIEQLATLLRSPAEQAEGAVRGVPVRRHHVCGTRSPSARSRTAITAVAATMTSAPSHCRDSSRSPTR